jgi:hypothetical protein
MEYWRGGPNDQHYVGSFIANVGNYSMPAMSFVEDGRAKIAESYSKMKPTSPDFSYLNSVYELKDVPGMLRKRFHDEGLRDVASHHVGIQFGWLPLLSDVRNLVFTQRGAQKRIKQLLRDNGRPVRRRINLLDEDMPIAKASGQLYGALQPVLVTQYYRQQPKWTSLTGAQDKWWASARYRYWLPDGPRDIIWQRKLLNRLYGGQVSPSVLYNMIPWTWLIDWFTNLGDVIDNLDAGVADRLGADYHYVMRKRTWYQEFHVDAIFKSRNGPDIPVTAHATTTAYVKTRVAGGPFDLRWQTEGLSPRQLGILGAMGISKL